MAKSSIDNQSRRQFLSTILQAGFSIQSAWARSKVDGLYGVPEEAKRKTAVSPPGSVSHEHLNSLCNGCQACISECPTKVLRPCTSEYGMEGILQPVLDFSKGYCDPGCTCCSEVCPTGAIEKLTESAKDELQIGKAVLVSSLCINASDDGICSVCEEVCPWDAIKIKEDYTSAMAGEGETRHFHRFPVIEDILCTGCGLCEYKCPSAHAKAIHVEGLAVHEES